MLFRDFYRSSLDTTAQKEDQIRQIREQQHERDDDAELFEACRVRNEGTEYRRQQQARHGQDHQRGIQSGQPLIELQEPVARAAGEERQAEHQQRVANDAAGDEGLHEDNQALTQRKEGDYQLRRVAEGRVEQAAPVGSEVNGELAGGVTDQ